MLCRLGLWNTPTASLQECKTLPNECPNNDTKQYDSVVSVMLELWGMQSITSLPLLQGQFRPGVVATDRVLSMGEIELNSVLMLNWIIWKRTIFDIEITFLFWTELFERELFWHLTELFSHFTVCKKDILIVNWIVWNLIWS